MTVDVESVGLARHAERTPEKVALVAGEVRRTYGELNARVNRLARALRRQGIGPGDCVAAVLSNGVEWLELLNALGKIGGLLVPVGYRLRAPEIRYMLDDSRASAAVVDPTLLPELERALHGADWSDDRVWVSGTRAGRGISYEDLLGQESDAEPEAAFVGGGYNVMIYTSGTTGRPRAVERRMSPDTVHLASLGVAQMWDFDAREVHLGAAPLYHTGPGAYVQLHLFIGATAVVMPHFRAAAALASIERYRVTNAFMVPTHFARILQLDEEERSARDLSSLRVLMHSSAPCPIHVKRGIMNLFPPGVVTEFYGSSESGFTRITAAEWLRKPGSVGRAWPAHEIRIIDEFGNPCATGDVGLIYVRGPHMDFRYRDEGERDVVAFRDGFFTAGDLGYLDEEGFLFIADRRTDLIISGGANVYPAEVESVLSQHASVGDVAVVGLPDDELGKIVVAVVEARAGTTADPADIIDHARRNLARYKCPARVEVVQRLPREPNGKIRKAELLNQFWPGW